MAFKLRKRAHLIMEEVGLLIRLADAAGQPSETALQVTSPSAAGLPDDRDLCDQGR